LILLEFFGLEFIFQMRNDKPDLDILTFLRRDEKVDFPISVSIGIINSRLNTFDGGNQDQYWMVMAHGILDYSTLL